MNGIPLKTVNPVVFDDPVYCNELKSESKKCDHLNLNYSKCTLFKDKLEHHFVSRYFESYSYWRKCQECKDHFEKNKRPISGGKLIADAANRITDQRNKQ